MLRREKYYDDYCFLKKMGIVYKLIKCNKIRIKGLEAENIVLNNYYRKNVSISSVPDVMSDLVAPGCVIDSRAYISSVYKSSPFVGSLSNSGIDLDAANSVDYTFDKLKNNISRAKNKIMEYVLCNDFQYFVTMTLDGAKINRSDLKDFKKKFSVFIRDFNKYHNLEIKYLLVPERHKDGNWHFHGFFMGFPDSVLDPFSRDDVRPLPAYILDKIDSGNPIYEFKKFTERFGWNVFDPIRDRTAAAYYCTKYINKDMAEGVKECGEHLYYVSRGLNKAEIVKEGQFVGSENFEFDYVHKYGASCTITDPSDDQINLLCSVIGHKPYTFDDIRKGYVLDQDGFQINYDSDTGEIFNPYYDLNNPFDGDLIALDDSSYLPAAAAPLDIITNIEELEVYQDDKNYYQYSLFDQVDDQFNT